MSISKSCGNDMDNKSAEFEQLERQLIDQLYFKNRVLQEIIDIAFADIFSAVEIKDGEMILRENPIFDAGIQVTVTKDKINISAPYRMKALDLLGKIFVFDEYEDSLKNKVKAEQLKVKQMMQRLNID